MKRYAVVLQPRARAQLDEAKAWWEQRSPSQAEAIDDALEAAVALLSRFPEIGHPIQVRGEWSQIDRVYSFDAIRYFIVYRIEHERARIVVTRFRHEKRRPLKRV
jgi:plasmid stabilization system protein ParE